MGGIHRNIALLLVLAATFVASSAEARVGAGGGAGAAAAKMTRGAQVRLNRMKQKMSLRPRGMMQQKTRRMLRLGKRRMMRAMSRREVGLHGSEAARARSAFARGRIGESFGTTGTTAPVMRHSANTRGEEELEKLSTKQRKK